MGYQMHAYQYVRAMFDHVEDWYDWKSVLEAVDRTNKHAEVTCGSARMVVIGDDFVIKWDYDKCVAEIGGCEDEFQKYKISLSSRYAYLLAPVFRFSYHDRYFYVMPKATDVGSHRNIRDEVNFDEYEWLSKNVGDLHSWNWGRINGKPVVIDYACRPNE